MASDVSFEEVFALEQDCTSGDDKEKLFPSAEAMATILGGLGDIERVFAFAFARRSENTHSQLSEKATALAS